MRRGLAILIGVALPLACGSFGETSVDPTTTNDGGMEAEASPPSTPPDAGPPLVCDRFATPGNPLGDMSFWASFVPTNKPPSVLGGIASIKAESSSDGYLQTVKRTRKDTIRFRGVFTVHAFEPEWGSSFDGQARIFDVDASIGTDPGEYTGLELDATAWRLSYRTFEAGTANISKPAGPPFAIDHEYAIDFEERFSPTDGYIHVSFDGIPQFTLDGLHNEQTVRTDWLLKVGSSNQGATPSVKVDFKEVCVSP